MSLDEKYPVNVAELKKGDFLSPETCEMLTGKKRDNPRYQFAMQSIREFIYRESEKQGRPLSCGIDGDGLRIHTDAEASEYHRRLHYMALRGMRRSMKRMVSCVDRAQLTSFEVAEHDRETALAALRVQAVREACRIERRKHKELTE